jgi:hypothetical protein
MDLLTAARAFRRPMSKGRRRERKVFVVSDNKCGTTTLMDYFMQIGWSVGSQETAETLYFSELLGSDSEVSAKDWLEYISGAEVFQDVPFSTPRFLPWLLNHFPDALYVHVKRNSDDWYTSLVHHHIGRRLGIAPQFSAGGSLIWTSDMETLSNAGPYRGFALHRIVQARYGTHSEDPYNKSVLTLAHDFQQHQARGLLSDRDSLLWELHELHDPQVAHQLAQKLGLATVVPLPWSNQG